MPAREFRTVRLNARYPGAGQRGPSEPPNCTTTESDEYRTASEETNSILTGANLERVTGIKPALSAWELACHGHLAKGFAD